MSTYAIGDIQGCFESLEQLLNIIQFNPNKDTLWFTGDLVNRGPDSLKTLRFIYQLHQAKQAITVLGNHDLALLTIAAKHLSPQPGDTIDEILDAPDKEELLAWLRQCPLIYHDPEHNYTLVHAGIPPQWPLKKALLLANEVEQHLQGANCHTFLKNMYGNMPTTWDDTLTGIERLRYIVNALTRMRFCQSDGTLELVAKDTPNHPPAGFKPWFEWPNHLQSETKLIFGHWAALNGQCQVPNLFALDTGCVWGNALTAFCLETKERFSVPCKN